MRGYLNADDLTERVVSHGWFATGDVGFRDDRGRLHLCGRTGEEINKGGMKIYPADIDSVVERFAHTVDVCAFGYDDPLQGEDVGIAVVLDRDHPDTRRALYEWTRRHLAPHRTPQRWYVLAEIPRNSHGKADRTGVARHCARLPAIDMRSGTRPGPEPRPARE
jgi:fatty-acyl-CoA synthase